MQYLNVDRSTKTPFQYLKKQILYEYFFENQKMWIFFFISQNIDNFRFQKKNLKKKFFEISKRCFR